MTTKFCWGVVLAISLHLVTDAQNLFMKRLVGTANWTYPGTSIIQLQDGSLMVGSYSAVIKADSAGNFLWGKYYGNGHVKILEGKDGYIYIGGGYDYDIALAKIDTAGNLLWSKIYNLGDSDDSDIFSDMVWADDSTLILTGSIMHYDGIDLDSIRSYFIRCDLQGNVTHNVTYTDVNSRQTMVYQIDKLSNNSYLLSGTNGIYDSLLMDGALIEVDAMGNVLKSFTIGTNTNEGLITRIYKDNGELVLYLTNFYGIGGGWLPILVSIDTSYTIRWHQAYDYSCNNFLFHPMIVGKINNNYIINSGFHVAELDSVGQPLYKKSTGASLTYEYKNYFKTGQYIYYTGGQDVTFSYTLIGKSDSAGFSGCNLVNQSLPCLANVNVSFSPLVIQTDSIQPVMNINPSSIINRPVPSNQVVCPPVAVQDNERFEKNIIRLNPNPSLGFVNIEFDESTNVLSALNLQITDLVGRLVFEGQVDGTTQLDLTSLNLAGFYIFSFSNSDLHESIKLIFND